MAEPGSFSLTPSATADPSVCSRCLADDAPHLSCAKCPAFVCETCAADGDDGWVTDGDRVWCPTCHHRIVRLAEKAEFLFVGLITSMSHPMLLMLDFVDECTYGAALKQAAMVYDPHLFNHMLEKRPLGGLVAIGLAEELRNLAQGESKYQYYIDRLRQNK